MFGLFGGKDVNVLAVIFVRRDVYQLSGQRVKSGLRRKASDGARAHARCLYWAVFDQKGKVLEAGKGAGELQVTAEVIKKLAQALPSNRSVQEILQGLESKQSDKLSKPLVWNGYPPREMYGADTQTKE